MLRILAVFNQKLKLGVIGRKNTFRLLKNGIAKEHKTFWFHCASLGEYEQGLPVFKALRKTYPDHKVVLSFFSPSGYEVRKNTDVADVVVYLPLDTKRNAKRFLDLVNPDYIIFVKYEIWPNLLSEIKRRKAKAVLISALFRETQSFFKWYGKFMRNALKAFQYIFTQDEKSKFLLESFGFNNITVAGDTRFDRVSDQLAINNDIPFLEEFVSNNVCIVFGSTWPADDELYIDYINSHSNNGTKFIIAPHNVKANYIEALKNQLKVKTVCYSEKKTKNLSEYGVFILDTIGYLSKAYSYASIAYVGGGAGTTGLHNILEPAVFGIPILIGKNYQKFPEAKSLIQLGGVKAVATNQEFENHLNALLKDESLRLKIGTINGNYIKENKGAVNQILDVIRI
jgi:3-deoxy-D-manno-octulosonic-acid transferase